MDWVALLSAVGGIISGGGLTGLLYWRANRRKAEAEASKIDAEGQSVISDAENRFIDQMQEQQDKYLQVFTNKDKKIDELYDKLRAAENKVVLCADNLCVHHGCGCRFPGRGLGLKWVNDHNAEADLGGDYYTCEQLMEKYRKRKMTENDEIAD